MSKLFESKYISLSKLFDTKNSKKKAKYDKIDLTETSQPLYQETSSAFKNEFLSSSLLGLNEVDINDLDQQDNCYFNKTCCKRFIKMLNYKSDKITNQIKLFTYSKARAKNLFKKKPKEIIVSYHADLQQTNIYVNENENGNKNKGTQKEKAKKKTKKKPKKNSSQAETSSETKLLNSNSNSHMADTQGRANEQTKSIIAFINPKSGGLKGNVVFEKFKKHLNSENIYDLSKSTPGQGLSQHKNTKNLKVVACGGDGTVGWVLSEVDKENFLDVPGVAILPLGTGNELSRTLGWGNTYNNESIDAFLKNVVNGKLINVDRWSITTTLIPKPNSSYKRPNHQRDELPVNVFNDFFSIGADAKIALDFHLQREKNPESFSSQFANKFEHVKIFGKDLFSPSCKNLVSRIKEFECDGISYINTIKKKNFHSLVFLNIPSYANGTNPWNNGEKGFTPQSYSDGKLEVIGFQTSDLMFIQLGGHGVNLAQASHIRIVTDFALPMQIDGEPLLLTQSEIIIEKKNQASMISIH